MRLPSSLTPDKLKQVLALIPFVLDDHLSPHQLNIQTLNDMNLINLQSVPDLTAPLNLGSAQSSSVISSINIPQLRQLFSDPVKFYQHTRFTVTEFTQLHSQLEERLRLTRRTKNSHSHQSKHMVRVKLTIAEQLFLWTMSINGTRITDLELIFAHLSYMTISRYCDHVTDVINSCFAHYIKWPSPEERRASYGMFSVHDKIIAVLDGTHCEIERPLHNEQSFWSGHKHLHTQNYLVAVNPLGVIIFVSQPYPGSWNDRGCYNISRIATHPSQFVSDGELILADGGFMGGYPLMVPLHKSIIDETKTTAERNEMLDHNIELSENRILVEDSFSWLKHTARVLEQRFTRERHTQGQIFHAACCWYNALRLLRIDYARSK